MLLGKTVISLVVNLYYTGNNGSAQKLVEEMESSGLRMRSERKKETRSMIISL